MTKTCDNKSQIISATYTTAENSNNNNIIIIIINIIIIIIINIIIIIIINNIIIIIRSGPSLHWKHAHGQTFKKMEILLPRIHQDTLLTSVQDLFAVAWWKSSLDQLALSV